MSKRDPQYLTAKIAQLSKQASLTDIALRFAFEHYAGPPPLYERKISDREKWTFYGLELDRVHGGIIVVYQEVEEQNGTRRTSLQVRYLHELIESYKQGDANSTWTSMLAVVIASALVGEKDRPKPHGVLTSEGVQRVLRAYGFEKR